MRSDHLTPAARGPTIEGMEKHAGTPAARSGTGLLKYLFRYPKDLIIQSVGGLLYDTVAVFGAVFLGRVIDAAEAVYAHTAPVTAFYRELLFFIGVTVFFQIARYFKRYYTRSLVHKMSSDIRRNLLEHLFTLPLGTLSEERTGDIMSRTVGDTDEVCNSVRVTTTELWDTLVLMLSYFVALLIRDPKLTLLASLPIPVTVAVTELLRGRLYRLSQESRKAASRINVHLRRSVNSVQLMRLFGLEQSGHARYEALLEDQYHKQVRFSVLQGGIRPLCIFLANIGVVLVIGMGGKNVLNGAWTAGAFTAYLTMFVAMATRTDHVAKVMTTWHGARASWDRIREKLTEEPRVDTGLSGSVRLSKEGLAVDDLSFRFPFARENAVEGVSFTAGPGQIIGITGPVGSGKSALAAAVSGLYAANRDPRVAYMSAQHFIFSDDVTFNIGMGDPNAKIGEGVALAELAGDIASFDDGMDTRLMEHGVRVSGGQRQRIALARAWAADCDFLILDDPFSAVDVAMEERIIANIREHIGHKTVLLFSHRLTVFPLTDRILLLENGRVTAQGTHDELMAAGGLYRDIYLAQAFLGGKTGAQA